MLLDAQTIRHGEFKAAVFMQKDKLLFLLQYNLSTPASMGPT